MVPSCSRVYTSIVDGAVSGARGVGRDAIKWFYLYTRPSSSPDPFDASIASWAGGRPADRERRGLGSGPSSIPMANPCVFGRTADGQHFWGSIDYPKHGDSAV